MVFPERSNHYHTLMGGQTLSMLDVAAFVAASRVARCHLVTAGAGDIRFLKPVPEGHFVEAVAEAITAEGKGWQVAVALESECLLTGTRRRCAEGRFVFVPRPESPPGAS